MDKIPISELKGRRFDAKIIETLYVVKDGKLSCDAKTLLKHDNVPLTTILVTIGKFVLDHPNSDCTPNEIGSKYGPIVEIREFSKINDQKDGKSIRLLIFYHELKGDQVNE